MDKPWRLMSTLLLSPTVLLIGLFAVGCGSGNNIPLIIATATATATIAPTLTPTTAATSTLTMTPTSAPTLTPPPSFTPTPTPSLTSAPTQSTTPTTTQIMTPTPTPTTAPVDAIIFSPPVTYVNNPTAGAGLGNMTASSSQFTINLSAYDANGNPITPSVSNPIHVDVYGAPSGIITPTSTTVTSGSAVTFTYSGGFFPNNISINGWISDPGTGGAAIGVTQVLMQNTPPCTLGSVNYSVPLTSTVPNELQVQAAVGYTSSTGASGHLQTYTIDTGSLGTIVTASDLPPNDAGINALVIGPAGPGVKCYDSSDNAFYGNYYLAPVDIQITSGSSTTTVQTNPIIVLGVNKFCKVPNCMSTNNPTNCQTNPAFHYLGVGFNRNSTAAGDLFNSPTANAFLHITDANNGTDINPGYILSQNGVTLGINSTSGYNLINLTANVNVPGDWNAQPACYGFPQLPPPNQFCGTGLLDVGINEMFIDLPFAQRPAGTFDSNNEVPANLTMNVLMGTPSNPAASYTYTTVQPPTQPTGPAPTYSQWIDKPATFVNTGRNPLNCYDYLFEGQCGQVGFEKLTPAPSACSGAQ